MDLDQARTLTLSRAQTRCEGCGAWGLALDVHHRQARGAGGVHGAAADASNDPRNMLALCRSVCHPWTEDAEGWDDCLATGWRVRHAYQGDARAVPALLHTVNGHGWWLLTVDAGYVWVDWPVTRRLNETDLADHTWFADVTARSLLDLL
jgi:hypothetical protein